MFAAIVIPNFELNAVLRHQPDQQEQPVALLLDDSKKARIHQLTDAAMHEGVAAGMTSTQAKARCPRLGFRLRSPAQEDAANEILLQCAYQSAAFIEATEAGVCTLDLRGLSLVRESSAERAQWALNLVQRLAVYFLPAAVGVAPAPGLALLAARAAAPVLEITDPEEFWRSLPVAQLGAPAPLVEVLRKWGIRSVAEFFKLGKDRIAERLGPEGIALFDRARADVIRPLKLTAPKNVYEEFFEFAEPIETLEPLLFIVRRFLDQLARRLEQGGLVMQALDLALLLESGAKHERSLEIPAPTREVGVLFRIVHNYLENVRTAAPVKAVQMRVKPVPAQAQQFPLFETAIRDPNQFFEMLGRIGALLGKDRVGVPHVEPTHRPDDVRMKPVSFENRPLPEYEAPVRRGLMLRRFRPPIPANVRLHETAPVFVRCTRVSGSIVQSQGPWRSSGNWWEAPWNREEWDIQTKDGGLYRLLREDRNWFIEGAYD